ncbi:hypothetical protein DERP_011641 [Dermatophagoides pteronyssinus]|uniref:Uncharacterized protein n=1 Tax=Dermatophagoides pteronyssinus TaxID=6956 RepID=A0ABQ8JXN5_DERPT|nr:hypothetical protein DERP_011641 [Dermatophagoides pteronyssinus]
MTSLPGEPDNIRKSLNDKTYWITLLRPRTVNNPLMIDYMMQWPSIRKLLVRLLDLIGMIFDWFYQILNKINDDFIYGGMLLEIDSNGHIIQCIYQTNNQLAWASEISEIPSDKNSNQQRKLYIGSFRPGYPIRKIIL